MIESRKKPRKQFFIIKFPDGNEALVKDYGWVGLIPYAQYFKPQYEEEIVLVAVNWFEAIKFILKGKLFNASR
jgi:hypothetical protein